MEILKSEGATKIIHQLTGGGDQGEGYTVIVDFVTFEYVLLIMCQSLSIGNLTC
jgi:hypothetical protein